MSRYCPHCMNILVKVRKGPDSPLNQDQFDSKKAGDYYCTTCPGNDRGIDPRICYWWHRETKSDPNCKHTMVVFETEAKIVTMGVMIVFTEPRCEACDQKFVIATSSRLRDKNGVSLALEPKKESF